MECNRKDHWENVYESKKPNQVSWTQKSPKTSLAFIQSFGLDKSAKIIDVGGGDSNLVDHLIENGYLNVTVLDISEKALEKAKKRLGAKADIVSWIVSDITKFVPCVVYDLWHDRAAFHFLTQKKQIETYIGTVNKYVKKYLILATFSKNGPQKCSGLEISQYSEECLSDKFNNSFKKIFCMVEDHQTPFDTQQNFLFCSFKKID